MSADSAPRPSRRCFLKLIAGVAAAGLVLQLPSWPSGLASFDRLRIQSAFPLPVPNTYLPVPERLLLQPPHRADLLLVPAYVAALLIRRGLVQPLGGPAGRAHDPDGAYTVPYTYQVAALRYPNESVAPKAASWADLWRAAADGQAVWPDSARLILGAALLRRGHSPNDTHPGHLAQAGDDLSLLRPRIRPHWPASGNDLRPAESGTAFVLADPAELGLANGLRLPVEGAPLIEYDWVIPASAEQPGAARRLIDQLRPGAQPALFNLSARLIPLMPLPDLTAAQHAEIWSSLAPSLSPLAA